MAEQSVILAPGESQVVAFEVTPTVAKTYQVSVDGLTGSFTALAAPPTKATLYGIVRDAKTKLSIAGVKVTLNGWFVTSADANGAYLFTNIEPDAYAIGFSKVGYGTFRTMITLVAGINEFNVELEPSEAFLLSVSLPSSVPAGNPFYPEYTLYLPKPWKEVNTPFYTFHLWIDNPHPSYPDDPVTYRECSLAHIYILPYQYNTYFAPLNAWLSNPEGVYTYRGTYVLKDKQNIWGPAYAVWNGKIAVKDGIKGSIALRLMEPGTYPVRASLRVEKLVDIEREGPELGLPEQSWDLGVVGDLTITKSVIPAPVIKARIVGFYVAGIGAWTPSPLPPVVSLTTYESNYLGIAFHNDTIVKGTTAEIDLKLARGPFEVEVTMDGSPWWKSEPFNWKPCEAWNKYAVFGELWCDLPGIGSHTVVATISAEGEVLGTKTASFSVVP